MKKFYAHPGKTITIQTMRIICQPYESGNFRWYQKDSSKMSILSNMRVLVLIRRMGLPERTWGSHITNLACFFLCSFFNPPRSASRSWTISITQVSTKLAISVPVAPALHGRQQSLNTVTRGPGTAGDRRVWWGHLRRHVFCWCVGVRNLHSTKHATTLKAQGGTTNHMDISRRRKYIPQLIHPILI